MHFFLPFSLLCHIVSLLCAVFRIDSSKPRVGLCHNVDFFSSITLPTTFYFTWPVVSIYGVVGNVVVEDSIRDRVGREQSSES